MRSKPISYVNSECVKLVHKKVSTVFRSYILRGDFKKLLSKQHFILIKRPGFSVIHTGHLSPPEQVLQTKGSLTQQVGRLLGEENAVPSLWLPRLKSR